MTDLEKEKILKAIQNTDINEDTKKIVSIMIELMKYDANRTMYMLLENTEKSLALKMLDEELLQDEKEISTEFVHFLAGELNFANEIEKLCQKTK